MVFHNRHYPRPLVPNTQDPSAVDFRAFYPYTPNEVKHRKRTTSQQLKVLEAIFRQDTKPNAQLRQELASELNMTARGVQVWFQNRRAKEKARAGRVSLAAKVISSADDELKEEENEDEFLDLVKTEAVVTELLLTDEVPSEELNVLNASASPLSDNNPSSPPELRVITDSAVFNWTKNDANEPPPDSATSCSSLGPPAVSTGTALPNNRLGSCLDLDTEDLYALRRGSLPVTSALYHSQASHQSHSLDPLVRRCSVDASLQRLALHPYANLARAKNTALYGAGVGVASSDSPGQDVPPISADGSPHYHLMNNRLYSTQRLQRRFVSSSALSAAARYGSSSAAHISNLRRLSMDSRALRLSSLQRTHSPSPSPLSTYSATTRSSLPESHLYSIAARPVGSPIPGPLPTPGFQFGAATSSTPSIASPSSIDSERNSPDSLRSFSFGGDEENQSSPPYEAYTSRFSSVASIATSESSLNSAYYGGSTVDQDRLNAACTAQYYTPPDLDVGRPDVYNLGAGDEMGIPTGIVVGYSLPEECTSCGESNGLPLPIPGMRRVQQATSEPVPQHQAYMSPMTPAIRSTSELYSPHGQDSPSMPISTSSELAFALESKHPELSINSVTQPSTPEAYVNFDPGEHVSQSPAEHYPAHQQTMYYTTEVQTYHQEQPTYPTAYPFTNDIQAPQQPSDFRIYSTTGDYSDPLVTPPVSGNNLQTAESFVTYS